MKVRLLLIAAISLLFTLPLRAQTTVGAGENEAVTEEPVFKHCFTDEMDQELIKNHPEVLLQRAKLDQAIKDWIVTHTDKNGGLQLSAAGNIIIPVVFHILHNYGGENI